MLTSTAEDYLKAIYRLNGAEEIVSVGKIATALGITSGTVTTMMKQLHAGGWVTYFPRRGPKLTDSGRQTALQVIRRHRLLEVLLVDVFEMDPSEVHAEAEILEHAVSERLAERIDIHLGRPSHDPHGTQIPDATGVLRHSSLKPLTEMPEGGRYDLRRLKRTDQPFIDWLAGFGIAVGSDVGFAKKDQVTGIVTLETAGGRRVQIGETAAAALWVE
jgi:DtxR family Mn-dependent transcriptional regulator